MAADETEKCILMRLAVILLIKGLLVGVMVKLIIIGSSLNNL